MNIWKFTREKLEKGLSLYLMIVVDAKGSSPGKQGFSMAVCSDNSLFGSIGGGVMEYNLVEECKQLLQENKYVSFQKKQLHKDEGKDSTGMMCSGEQTISIFPIDSKQSKMISEIYSCLSENRTGILQLTEKGLDFHTFVDSKDEDYSYIKDESGWKYQELIGIKNTIYIIGAGHVGFSVSQLFSQLGFDIVLLDNRPNLTMMDENRYANKKLVIDYDNVDKYVVEGKNSYVIIMTNSHQHDVDVLRCLLRKKLRYLGLMGSKNKVAKFKAILESEGFTDDELGIVHAPIGISISSITPDEIAVSIAAEVILIKNS